MAERDYTIGPYRIWFDPPPIPTRECDWHYQHQDDEGEPSGRSGHGPSYAYCLGEIIERQADEIDALRATA